MRHRQSTSEDDVWDGRWKRWPVCSDEVVRLWPWDAQLSMRRWDGAWIAVRLAALSDAAVPVESSCSSHNRQRDSTNTHNDQGN